jgi:hypothetical protein
MLLFTIHLIIPKAFSQDFVERKLFVMEKNFHTANIMVISARTDQQCKFVSQNNEYMDFYWLMDGIERKKIHPLIRRKIQEKVKFISVNIHRDSFKMAMNDITMEVSSSINNGVCRILSVLKLGASLQFRKIHLARTYCEVTTNLFGIPNGCKFINLQGTDAETGSDLKVQISNFAASS